MVARGFPGDDRWGTDLFRTFPRVFGHGGFRFVRSLFDASVSISTQARAGGRSRMIAEYVGV